jgi:hypothetical protein
LTFFWVQALGKLEDALLLLLGLLTVASRGLIWQHKTIKMRPASHTGDAVDSLARPKLTQLAPRKE